LPAIHDLVTWAPLLGLMWAGDADGLTSPGVYVAGQVDRRGGFGFSSSHGQLPPLSGGAIQAVAGVLGFHPTALIRDALTDAGLDSTSYMAQFSPDGSVKLHLITFGPAVEDIAGGIGLGSLVLVEGAVPEPWRRTPAPRPRAKPHASVDLELLERTLRERFPDAIGATDEEITASESRLGLALPDELKVLYRVRRGRWTDRRADPAEDFERVFKAVGCEPFPLDELYLATTATRPCPWVYASKEAAITLPGDAVQRLVGSPGWIVFGSNGGGDLVAIDLTPGPRGNIGQVIMIDHEQNIGASLFARSLTAMVKKPPGRWGAGRRAEMPFVARVNWGALRNIESAAGPDLEVLSIGVWEDEPLSLAPVADAPRLRTLTALPGTLADPLEIATLTGLEFLELGPEDWRVLLDADAVPRGLLAAAVDPYGSQNPLAMVALANELLARWDRPLITKTLVEGDLNEALTGLVRGAGQH